MGQDCWSLNWKVGAAVGKEGRQAGLIVEGPVLNNKEFTLDFCRPVFSTLPDDKNLQGHC